MIAASRSCGEGRRRRHPSAAIMIAILCGIATAGCTASDDVSAEPSSPASTEQPAPAPTPSETPTPRPTLAASDDAEHAMAVFDDVNEHTLQADPEATGQQLMASLVDAGFDVDDMQLTADKTSVGLDAGSVQFAVLWGDECLIGQNGEGSEGYHSQIAPVLPTGDCLIGQTVPITTD